MSNASLNKVTIIGTVGKDPECRTFTNGGRVANLSLATSESWKDKATGEKKEKTEWIRVAIFNEGLVGVVEKYVRKGQKLYVEGKLQTRKWTDAQGVDKYTTEVVLQGFDAKLLMLSSPKQKTENAPAAAEDDHKGFDAQGDVGQAQTKHDDLSDEIPF
jgi:single-strand DNA-binding protein